MNMQYQSDADALKQTVARVAAIVDRLETRSDHAVQKIQSGVAILDQGARRLNGSGEQLAGEALQLIGARAHQALGQSVARAAAEFGQQLHASADKAQRAAEALAEQRRLLTAAQSALVWKGLVALAIGSLLAAIGCGLFAWYSLREVRNAEFDRDILRATQTGVLTPCGDGALCIKVGRNPRRAGKDGEYRVLVD
jgi:hypothetical protein